MITNRDIQTVELFDQALDEVIESARENDVSEQALADTLRDRAADLVDEHSN